jgi:hypothetical protein
MGDRDRLERLIGIAGMLTSAQISQFLHRVIDFGRWKTSTKS